MIYVIIFAFLPAINIKKTHLEIFTTCSLHPKQGRCVNAFTVLLKKKEELVGGRKEEESEVGGQGGRKDLNARNISGIEFARGT